MTLKGTLAALLLSISLGLSSGALAQEVAPINVNTADAELLAELPGIGPSRAEAIIEERETNASISSTLTVSSNVSVALGLPPSTACAIK